MNHSIFREVRSIIERNEHKKNEISVPFLLKELEKRRPTIINPPNKIFQPDDIVSPQKLSEFDNKHEFTSPEVKESTDYIPFSIHTYGSNQAYCNSSLKSFDREIMDNSKTRIGNKNQKKKSGNVSWKYFGEVDSIFGCFSSRKNHGDYSSIKTNLKSEIPSSKTCKKSHNTLFQRSIRHKDFDLRRDSELGDQNPENIQIYFNIGEKTRPIRTSRLYSSML